MAGSLVAMTTAGSSLAISATLPAAVTPTGYAAVTFTTINEITDLGAIGRVYNIVTHNPVATRGTQKLKGSYNDGDMSVKMAYAPGDPGQALLLTALDDDDFYSFKLTLQDGTVKYFEAQVSSLPTEAGGVDTITGSTAALAIKSGTIVTVLP